VVTVFLSNSDFQACCLWDLVKNEINYSKEGVLIVDDSVQDKHYSRFIELVKLQYSGNEKGLVCGINLVNIVFSEGLGDDFYPIDSCVCTWRRWKD
jgi:hypothetical protein